MAAFGHKECRRCNELNVRVKDLEARYNALESENRTLRNNANVKAPVNGVVNTKTPTKTPNQKVLVTCQPVRGPTLVQVGIGILLERLEDDSTVITDIVPGFGAHLSGRLQVMKAEPVREGTDVTRADPRPRDGDQRGVDCWSAAGRGRGKEAGGD